MASGKPTHPGHHRLKLESLELRRLMAIDLAVEHDTFEPANPGDEVTRVIRVYNHGDDVAEDVLVRSSLTDELENPTWERTLAKSEWIRNTPSSREKDFELFRGENSSNVHGMLTKAVGDLNGDGLVDFLFQPNFGSSVASVVFGGLKDSVKERVGELSAEDATIGFNIKPYSSHESRWTEYQSLGDINNDGFDDLAYADRVLFGSASLADNEMIDLEQLEAGQVFQVPNALEIFGIGDANADGVDDLAVSSGHINSYLLFGGDYLDRAVNQDAAVHVGQGRGTTFAGFVSHAAPVGDLNGDGAGDFAIAGLGAINVFFAHSEIADRNLGWHTTDRNAGLRITTDFDFNLFSIRGLNKFAGNVAPAGDFDGDGFDDMLVSLDGGDCTDCTATERSNRDRIGGAVVIFGGPEVGRNGTFHETDRHSVYRVATPYYGEQRPFAVASDIDGDGVSDLQLRTDAVTHILLGGNELRSFDFGFSGNWDADFELSLIHI